MFKFEGLLIFRGIVLARLHIVYVPLLWLSLEIPVYSYINYGHSIERNYDVLKKRIQIYIFCCILYFTFTSWLCKLFYSSETACPTVLLSQSLKVIHGFLILWPSVLSHVNFDLRKLLQGQEEMTLPPIVQQLTLQILLQAPPGSLKWYQQVSVTQQISIGPLHDSITWYRINYTGMQITLWDFQNKEKLGWLYECFMLEG